MRRHRPLSAVDPDLKSIKVPCEHGDFLYIPAARVECGALPGSLCDMFLDSGEYVQKGDIACVANCPPGYVPVLRRSTMHEGGEMHACLRPEVLSQVQQQQPGGARRMLTDIEIAGIGLAGVLGVGILGFLIIPQLSR
jgi:hypothetical protein